MLQYAAPPSPPGWGADASRPPSLSIILSPGNRAAKGRPTLVMARALGSTAAWLRNEDGAQERESWVKATRDRWTLTEREVDRRACDIWPHIGHNRDGPRLDPIDVTVCHAGASPEPFEIH